MNNKIYTIIIISIFMLISSCVPEKELPPDGVWKSEEPNLILFLLPEYKNFPIRTAGTSYLGIYAVDGYKLRVFPSFGTVNFSINYDIAISRGGAGVSVNNMIIGRWRLVDGQIHYTPNPPFRERLGYELIIFHEIEYYDPIDPTEWITEELEALIEHREEQQRQRESSEVYQYDS